MSSVSSRRIKKTAKIVAITIGSFLLLLFLLPYIMPGTISREIKKLVNESIEGKVEFSKARLSFFNRFPSLTLTLYDFTSTGSDPYPNETLIAADELAFGISIPSLIRGNINVNKFYISGATINVLVDEKGNANYNVYKSSAKSPDTTSSGDTTTSLKIEKIVIEKSRLLYNDSSTALYIKADGLDYSGTGDLTKAIFDLSSHITVDSFDFYLYNEPYINKKRINADLVTRINTNSLLLEFTRNKLRINRLPLEFKGKFEFLSRGYAMNFELNSDKAELDEVFSVLPPTYQQWLEETRVRGDADIKVKLAGNYIDGTDTMPDLSFDMDVKNGLISHKKAPEPVKNIYLDFGMLLPSLALDRLKINIDTLFFNLGQKDYFSASIATEGFASPHLTAAIKSELDMAMLDRALGLQEYDLKGRLAVQLDARGRYAKGLNPNRIRDDYVITSIPSFNFKSSMTNGYLRYTALPQPIQKIDFTINASCPDSNYKHISASVENIDVEALNNYLKGFIKLKNADNFPIEADLDGLFRLADIKQFYPLEKGTDLNGNMVVKIKSNGNYQPDKKKFPKTEASIKIENATVKTNYYPSPIEKINVDATVQNKEGTLSDLDVNVKPISLEFEGKPFIIKANLQDFDNIHYNIESKGQLDLGRIYKVFSQEGWDLQGTIETDLSLKGNQNDAMAQRYSRLDNKGTLKINNIVVYSDLYPLPFLIDQGVFRFNQDLLTFENFRTKYGKSTMTISGTVANLFNYVSGDGPLRGNIHLQSSYILLDELMAYNTDTVSSRPDSLETGSSGVIMVPADLDLKMTTAIDTVEYNKLHIKSVKGEVVIKDAILKMNQTGLELAGAKALMNADYRTLSPARALFNYNIKIDSFDVKRMYNEVELFKELAPAAASAEGIVSLDYQLRGKLDGNMYPIMPSLKGGGVLGVKNVKMKGFKFFSTMSKETGKSEINDPDLKKINFKTKIANNIVTLEKVKIKVSGFRIRLQGQSSLDGKIKFNCRLGLPPFGIFGIPMSVTGTGMNPKFKLGKTDKLPLEEEKEEMEDVDTVTTKSTKN